MGDRTSRGPAPDRATARPAPARSPEPSRYARSWVAGITAAALLVVLIWAGSVGFTTFDSALVGYAVAVVALTLAVVARYSRWLRMPSTGRYWRRGWQLFTSWDNFRRLPGLFPRAAISQLLGQGFIRRRGIVRWIGHQCLFWGVIGATLITFPLVFGWLVFHLEPGTESTYRMFVFGFPTVTFETTTFIGWSMFRALVYTAVLVIIGCVIFFWRRFRDRSVLAGQRLGYDMVPLLALLVISITGLLLTVSTTFFHGSYYGFLVITHMASVVLSLVFIPFGKFFHVLQRPASVGIQMYTEINATADPRPCRRCGEPLASSMFVEDLQKTLHELGQHYRLADDTHLVELCPRCKRVVRGQAYFAVNGRGF